MKLHNFDPRMILPTSRIDKRKPGRKATYPWDTLELGHEFLVKDPGAPALRSMQTMCYQNGSRLGRTFRVQEQNVDGVRTLCVGRYSDPVLTFDTRPASALPLVSRPGRPLKVSFDIRSFTEIFPEDNRCLYTMNVKEFFVWPNRADYEWDGSNVYNVCRGVSGSVGRNFSIDHVDYRGEKVYIVARVN